MDLNQPVANVGTSPGCDLKKHFCIGDPCKNGGMLNISCIGDRCKNGGMLNISCIGDPCKNGGMLNISV